MKLGHDSSHGQPLIDEKEPAERINPTFVSLARAKGHEDLNAAPDNNANEQISGLLDGNSKKKNSKKQAAIYECDIHGCNKAFNTKYSLKRHYNKHYSKKSLKCRFCPKKFCLAQYKREHEYTHTGEKPFACPTCPARFRQRGKLSNHRKLC